MNAYRSKRGYYDCIVPVTGGSDSYYTVHLVKNILRLNPLLVNYNTHFSSEVGLRNLANLRTKFDCDFQQLTISPKTIKRITKHTLENNGSIYWHVQAGKTTFPVRRSIQTKIPLIIWGAHQGIDQVGMYSHYQQVEMTRKYRLEHDLFNKDELKIMIDSNNSIKEEDIHNFIYPDDSELLSNSTRGIYLNNYFMWDSTRQHIEMIKKYNYKSLNQRRTFDNYSNIDCLLYNDLHDYIKLIKFGYSKINDHVAREIRLKRISKQLGAYLINKYVDINPIYLEKFCNWLEIDITGFKFIMNKFYNKTFWKKKDNLNWKFLGKKYKLLNPNFSKEIDSFNNLYSKNQFKGLLNKNSFLTFSKGIY